ncbi:MAG: type IV pili methyl-accepting chemotaxis transducer N-terminal domain-containing protein [Gammaproteobacteria bacterium]|nr:type IV pili methyl-accepting chemotaxis transducer N-terminal domain-containing protein [Gammaproteobacteria bacterium]
MAKAKKSVNQNSYGSVQALLFVIAIGLLIAVAYNFFLLNQRNTHQQLYIVTATDIRVQVERLAKAAGESAVGNFSAFEDLRNTRNIISDNIAALRNGDPARSLPPSPAQVNQTLTAVESLWSRINERALSVEDKEELVQELADSADLFTATIPILQARTDEAIRTMTEAGASSAQVFIASRQLVLADRMLRHVVQILQGGLNAVTAADNLSRDSALFGQVLDGLIEGNPQLGLNQVNNLAARAIFNEVRNQFEEASTEIDNLLTASSQLSDVRLAADDVFIDSEDLSGLVTELSDQYRTLGEGVFWPSLQTGLLLGAATLALFILIGLTALGAARQRSRVAAETNQRNQEAILRLLDEMSSLADGDLTVEATVTEDITGAIADAVNFAVSQLRGLVTGINQTAVQVAAQAQETRATAAQVAEASEHQSEQVDAATETINKMNTAFGDMARQAEESAKVAERSVATANDGANRVRETIEGMDAIRGQIQETSKRIKRLGESSQEIGDIVELINGISEQTNMLALNAAIQAASAGGAGRGFAVVADEVQRLAERATNATRRIETLVQTIQGDTSEAVNSMELTTTQVVKGAKTAEDAGQALNDIESISNELAQLIARIAQQSDQSAKTAAEVTRVMNSIREISEQNRSGTNTTTESIQQLARQVQALSDSVSDFKLPAEPDYTEYDFSAGTSAETA